MTTSPKPVTLRKTAEKNYGAPLPDWLDAIVTQSELTSLRRVASRIDVSQTTLSLLIAKNYAGDTGKIIARIRDAGLTDTLATDIDPSSYLAKAKRDWVSPPDWILALIGFIEQHGVAKASRRIDYAPSVISQLINNTYEGNLSRIEDNVRAECTKAEVECPRFGPIPLASCLRNQRRKPPLRGQDYITHQVCHGGCPNCRSTKK